MIKVNFMSDETNAAQVVLQTLELPYVPEIGDYVDVLTITDDDKKEYLKDYLLSIRKINLGHVTGRVWRKEGSGAELLVTLSFEDNDVPDSDNNQTLSEGFFH